jgi:hypothetical protein
MEHGPPPRLPSPLLVADFRFREEFLIEHYFNYPFKRQFSKSALKGTKIPATASIQALISLNPALRHACCALAALSFPSYPPPSQREVLAHHGLAIAFLRKTIVTNFFDESMLLAIIELLDFEVCFLHLSFNFVEEFLRTFRLGNPFGCCSFGRRRPTLHSKRSHRWKFYATTNVLSSQSHISGYPWRHLPLSSSSHVPTTHSQSQRRHWCSTALRM